MHRLHKAREFSEVLGSRQSKRGEFFSLHHQDSLSGIARLGLVIPKRLARHATTRNLIRRQVREVFRSRLATLPPVDLVLRLTRSTKELGFDREMQKQKFRADIELLLVFGNEQTLARTGIPLG